MRIRGIMRVVAATVLCLLCGCIKVGPDYERPDLSKLHNEQWQSIDEQSPTELQPGTTQLTILQTEAEWWKQFNDPALDALVTRLFSDNISLAVARERIVEAWAKRGIARADLLPSAYVGAAALRTGTGNDSPPLLGMPGTQNNLFAGGALAGWEIDLWGRVRRLVEAADAEILSAGEAYKDAAVSLVAELVLSYVDVRALEQRTRLSRQSIQLLDKQVALAQNRYASGVGSELDILRLKQQVHQHKAEQAVYEQGRRVALHGMAVLLGKPPGNLDLAQGNQLVPPTIIGMDIPANVLSRRPDVRQAEHEYAASVARVGAAMGERLPRIALGGVLSFQATDIAKLFTGDSLVYTFGAGMVVPIFTGGRIDAKIETSRSQSEQKRLELQQTVLQALAEVENSAVGVMQTGLKAQELQQAAWEAKRNTELSKELFDNGLAQYGEVVSASLEQVAAEDTMAVTRQQELGEVIHLYRAFGGGWTALSDMDETAEAQEHTDG